MKERYKNQYRIPSARLQGYDYGQDGAYFITICTQDREHFFGEIANEQMQLNVLGQLSEKFWLEIPIHFPLIALDSFFVMPNHVHGILIINTMDVDTTTVVTETENATKSANENLNGNANAVVETRLIASLQSAKSQPFPPSAKSQPFPPSAKSQPFPSFQPFPSSQQPIKKAGGFAENKNPMFYENISRIIRWYKGWCAFEMRKTCSDFRWQSRFHDHIIRNTLSFERIQTYIENNPANWMKDKFYG